MNSWVTWVIQAIIMIGVGAIGWFFKQTYNQFKADQQKHDEDIGKVEQKHDEDISKVEQKHDERISKVEQKHGERITKIEEKLNELPFIYTTRDDFIRAMANVETKLDKIYDKLNSK